MIVYISMDIGCIECGEDTTMIGIYKTKEEAKKSWETYADGKPNKYGSKWGDSMWNGAHAHRIFEGDI